MGVYEYFFELTTPRKILNKMVQIVIQYNA